MGGNRRFGFRAKILALTAVAAVGGIAVQVLMNVALHAVKVGGPLSDEVVRQKEILNDLTPPALYLRGPWVVLTQVAAETDAARQQEMVQLYRKLVQQFEERKRYWQEQLRGHDGDRTFEEKVIAPANEFFQAAEREVLPSVGPVPLPKPAADVIRGKLARIYERQELGVKEVSDQAVRAGRNAEDAAAATVRWWNVAVTGVGGAFLLFILGFGWWIARGIVGPTNVLIARMREMAAGEGDLTARVATGSGDEIGELSAAIDTVIRKLHDLVVKVRESSIQLYASSTEIAATAREQEATMQNLGASTNQIAAAVREITATASELSKTMNGLSGDAKQAGKAAAAGRAGLAGMGSAMQRLASGTESISAKLGAVREKANDINAVVTTITKVADQTNLLSINAAIEAEKAGESGRGFLVVAREIRRLADQTAVATLDIENMVRQMQAAVSAGVMEMDRFADEVRGGVSRVGEINAQMGDIIEQVQHSTERFEAVNESMAQQSAGAAQINDAMLQLAAGVQQTSASLKEFHAVTGGLRDAADALKQQVAKFTVAG
jgi:methyl-accepting chemotaxis protein WspA